MKIIYTIQLDFFFNFILRVIIFIENEENSFTQILYTNRQKELQGVRFTIKKIKNL